MDTLYPVVVSPAPDPRRPEAADGLVASEVGFVARLRAGDDLASTEFVETYGARMLCVARRFVKNEADAEDVVQEGFLQAFRALEGFAGDSQLSTWLHRIVVNAALMKLRTRSRKPETSIEELLPAYLEDGHQAHPTRWRSDAVSGAERQETRALVREKIEELPETHRVVILMRDIEELSTEETAGMLGISPNAVKVRLHRARQALRTLLDPTFAEVLA